MYRYQTKKTKCHPFTEICRSLWAIFVVGNFCVTKVATFCEEGIYCRLLKASHAHLHEHKHEREHEREQAQGKYHVQNKQICAGSST
jgi:hypothetical protein